MSDSETLEKLQRWIRSAGTEYEEPAPPQLDADNAIRGVLEENKRLRGLLEAQEKSRVSVEEWSQEKSLVIDRLTAQRDEALAAMNADTADVVLAKCVAESEVHRLLEENEVLGRWHHEAVEEIERLRAERTELQESNKHWFARVKAAEARIDAALAVVMGTRAVGNPHLESVLTKIVKALRG